MNVRIKDLYKYIFLLTVFYVYTKAFWDTFMGTPVKLFFYGAVFFGILLFIVQTVVSKRENDILVLMGFLLYAMYIIYNGKTLSNNEQFSQGMLEYILYTFYFLSSIFYAKRSNVKLKDLGFFIYLGEVLSLLAVYEYLTKKAIIEVTDYTIYYYEGGYSSFRAKVFCVSPMTMCMMLGLLLLLSVYLYYVKKEKCSKILRISPIVLLVGMFCTGSRGPLIATICGLLVMSGLNWMNNPITKKKGTRSVVFAILLIIFEIWIQFSGGLSSVRTGLDAIDVVIRRFSSATDFTNEWGNVARLRIWTKYIKIWEQHFWSGIGIAQTSSTVASNTYGVTESGVLKRLVETGVSGLILYVACILLPAIRGVLLKKNMRFDKNLTYFAIGVMTAILIEDIILQMFADVMVMYVFWAIIAIIYTNNYRRDKNVDRM